MSLAYLFERFPAPTQTFCVREVSELLDRGLHFTIFSIRQDPEAASIALPPNVASQLTSLPREDALRAFYDAEKKAHRLPQAALLTIRHWGTKNDKERVYEAIWLGQRITERNRENPTAAISHIHCHFAGLAARTCWWLRQLYGIRYSFTAHANDVFCQDDTPVTLAHLIQAAETVVTVSEFTAQWLRDHFPAAKSINKVRVVYNGLEMEPIAQQTGGIPKATPPLIASVGRLIEKKGFDDLISACGLLRDQSVPFQCEIMGGGTDEAALRQQIEMLGLVDHVRLLGSQGQAAVRQLLGRASVFALPCVTERTGGMDNLPTVLMEAMAARLPCASTFLAGVPEMVENGVTGLLCGERQPAAFAGLLQQILADTAGRERMGQAGWQRCQRLFAKEKTIPHLLSSFASVGAVKLSPALLRDGQPSQAAYPLRARLQHLFQKSPLKAACEPAAGGLAAWKRES